MKFVIDTNVVLSALFSKNGASHQLLHWLFQQEQQVNVVSIPLVLEYHGGTVLYKFTFQINEI